MINIFIQQSSAFINSLLSDRKKENKTRFAEVSAYISVWNLSTLNPYKTKPLMFKH